MATLEKENMQTVPGGGIDPSTSFTTTASASSTKLVADSKKFNATRIRRRMMEQQQRIASSRAAGANIRKPLTSKNANQDIPATTTTAGVVQTTTKKHPTLAIAVSMSEDVGDNDNAAFGTPSQAADDDSATESNVSAWAMIEHYGHTTGFDNTTASEQQKQDMMSFWNDRPTDSSTVFHTAAGEVEDQEEDDDDDDASATSSQGNALSTTAISHGIFVNRETTPSTRNDKIEWYADANGELVQHSICTESSFNYDMSGRDGNGSNYSGDGGDPEYGIGGSHQSIWDNRDAELDQDEKKEMDDDEASSPPTSLLQESAILSEFAQSSASNDFISEMSVLEDVPERPQEEEEEEVAAESLRHEYSVNASFGSHTDNATQISIGSFEQSDSGADSRQGAVTGLVSGSPKTALRSPKETAASSHHADRESVAAHARIEELKQNLKEQQFHAGKNESKLKSRVKELEQTLRTSVTTPRGSVMQEDPLKALLDRNLSLVKEVRFADQTCLELGTKMSTMEASNKILCDEKSELQRDNDRLSKELEAKTNAHDRALDEKQRTIDGLLAKLQATEGIAEFEKQATDTELSHAQENLEEANARIATVEENRDRETNDYLAQIRSLEEQLKQATDHMYLYQEGPTSPRLLNADQRVFALEKELAHSKASIHALQSQLERSLSSSEQTVGANLSPSETGDLIVMVRESMSRILNQYRSIEGKVNDTVDHYADRLEHLTATVASLRESLIFESDSVSTHIRGDKRQAIMDAVIDTSQYSQTEDEMLQLMEEARSPMSYKPYGEDQSADDGDLSRLFTDDMTLESMTKLESVTSSFSYPDRYKEPLEIAIKECRRVKDIAIGLKNDLDARKHEIERLEIENGKLSLQASRQTEENALVENALAEARQRVEELESQLATLENEKREVQKGREESEDAAASLRKEKSMVEVELQTATQKQKDLERQMHEVNCDLDGTREKLQHATSSSNLLKSRHEELVEEYKNLEGRISAEKQGEIKSLEEALTESRREVLVLKEYQEDIMAKLNAETRAKSEHESMVVQLQADKQQILSDAEDRLLEERFKQEDTRIKTADLKSKLTRKEKELKSMQESFLGYQKRAEQEVQRRDSALRSLKAELSDFVSCSKKLSVARADFCELLQSRGLDTDWLQHLSRYESSSVGEASGRAGEIAIWAQAIPNIGSSIRQLIDNSDNAAQLQMRVDMLNDNLASLHETETEYKKQIREDQEQNDKLLSLLRQAEQEMDRSAKQIRELSGALSRMQEEEAHAAEKADSSHKELMHVQAKFTNELAGMTKERDEAIGKLSKSAAMVQEKESRLFELENQLVIAHAQISSSAELIQTKDEEGRTLLSKINSLETKCSRLRDFIKKLTLKCDEWEVSYEKQGQAMEKLQARDARTRERAAEIANRYQKLVSSLKRRTQHHKDDREKWTAERSHLHQVHTRLEEELETIARELSTIEPGTTAC
mmetsp:Transcript_58588/g.88367  ORF Transcript_58588/g.88367 Transcript_58588/m.88367 type:complete len:1469 (+) Transcript_58588:145-4551(+)